MELQIYDQFHNIPIDKIQQMKVIESIASETNLTRLVRIPYLLHARSVIVELKRDLIIPERDPKTTPVDRYPIHSETKNIGKERVGGKVHIYNCEVV